MPYGQYENTVITDHGDPKPGAQITVYDNGTTNISTIYETSSGITKANPFYAGNGGYFIFFAANGTYDVKISMVGSDDSWDYGVSVSYTSTDTGVVKEIYPEWYGAVGDGVTDDTTAIQNAINQAASSGATLKFFPKAYNYSQLYLYYDATLNPGWPYDGESGFVKYKNTITIEGTSIEGRPQFNAAQSVGTILYSTYTGTDATILKEKPTGESTWYTTTNFIIKDLTIIANNSGYVLDLKYFNSQSRLDHLYIQQNNVSGSGALLQEVYFTTVRDCAIHGPSASSRGVVGLRIYNEAVGGGIVSIEGTNSIRNFTTGIDVGGHTYNDGIAGAIDGIKITTTEVADYDIGILIGWNVVNAVISGANYFEHTGGYIGADSIRIAYGASNISIEDNFLHGSVTKQIHIGYDTAVNGVNVKNNSIWCTNAVGAYGIYIATAASSHVNATLNRFNPLEVGANTTAIYNGTANTLSFLISVNNTFNNIQTWYTNPGGIRMQDDAYGNIVQSIFGLSTITRNVNGDGSVTTNNFSSFVINPSATPITSFPNETNKIMIIRFVGVNTVVHSATLRLNGGVDFTAADGSVLMFYNPTGLFWTEIPNR